MFKTHNILNFGFPVYLIVFEILLRSISSVDTSGFIGPTLAASGLGLLIGTIRPKSLILDPETQQLIQQQGGSIVVRNSKDEKVIILGWIAILLELLAWYWSCAITIKNETIHVQSLLPLYVGIGNYIAGIILSSVKEIV
jgi:hypothetical protein